MDSLAALEAVQTPTDAEAARTVATGAVTTPKTEDPPQSEAKVAAPAQATTDANKAPVTTQETDKPGAEVKPDEGEAYRANYNKFIDHVRKSGSGHLFESFKAGDVPVAPISESTTATEKAAEENEEESKFDPYNPEHQMKLMNRVMDGRDKEQQKVTIINAVKQEELTVKDSFLAFRQGLVNEGLDSAVEIEILGLANAQVARYNIDTTIPGNYAALGEAVATHMEMEMERRGLMKARQTAHTEGVAAGKLVNAMATASSGVVGEKDAAPVNKELKKLQDAVVESSGVDTFLAQNTKK